MIKLGPVSEFESTTFTELCVKGINLLLIHQDAHFYLIENKCGHFEASLVKGELSGEEIICPSHGISFSLITGEVVNRPYENCDKIRTFTTVQQGSELYLDDECIA